MVPASPLILIWIKTHICLVCMKDPTLPVNHLLVYKSNYNKEINVLQQTVFAFFFNCMPAGQTSDSMSWLGPDAASVVRYNGV